MLTGNIVAICFSGLVCIIVSMISPQDFEWALLKEIPTIEEQAEVSQQARAGLEAPPACPLQQRPLSAAMACFVYLPPWSVHSHSQLPRQATDCPALHPCTRSRTTSPAPRR